MSRTAQDTEMPFLDHLEELRHRLFWIVGAILVGVVLAFVVLSRGGFDVVAMLAKPIEPYLSGRHLVFTHPGTSFKIVLNASLILGILVATPVIAYQLWGFFAPALHPHEKRIIVPVMFGMIFLFLCGVMLAYFVVIPFTLKFFMGFESNALTPMIEATEYFGFVFSMMLAFGVAFELPIAILLLSALGIVNPKFLSRYRRHAIVITVVVAAFITPDASPTTLFALSVPLYLLYELGVALSYSVTRRRRQRAEAAEREQQQRMERAVAAEAVRREPRRLGANA
ncbi:MAG TPA: twin-arginine translocase subunit TatC [Gemmatimonadaceae bacterium]|jgi:sec-independent protein translocase protein TatC|nr:twin-arginine translocase subunit TatC [Gemmatimonadaceae bacterium]